MTDRNHTLTIEISFSDEAIDFSNTNKQPNITAQEVQRAIGYLVMYHMMTVSARGNETGGAGYAAISVAYDKEILSLSYGGVPYTIHFDEDDRGNRWPVYYKSTGESVSQLNKQIQALINPEDRRPFVQGGVPGRDGTYTFHS